MVRVTLSWDEYQAAAIHGVFREVSALQKHRNDRSRNRKHGMSLIRNIQAACAEMAYCKKACIYWSGLERIQAKDGGFREVRWTEHTGTGGLIAYEKDVDADYIVLVDGWAPHMNLIGRELAWVAKEESRWVPNGGYFLTTRESLSTLW